MSVIAVTPEAIQHAAELLHQGKLVALPTETVYGLGADARNPEAIARIFAAKGRPADHPLIVHLAYASQISEWAVDIPAGAYRLAQAFWPGPLTLILKKHPRVPSAVTGGQDSVGLRVPDHPVALWLLRVFGGGVAAPSANRFGHISPTAAEHVFEELADRVDCILDGGRCTVGVESTIVDLSGGEPVILRPGRITQAELEEVLGRPVALKTQHHIRAPGMMAVHYAPTTPTYLCNRQAILQRLAQQPNRLGVLWYGRAAAVLLPTHQILPEQPHEYEHALYATLRQLDQQGLEAILVETPPEGDAWVAIRDRLGKASVEADFQP
jgi:L-threonylcarbamoyladenylate synthase